MGVPSGYYRGQAMSGNNRSLQAELRTRPVDHRIQTARSTPVNPADAERGRVSDAITARIAAAKAHLLAGGVLQEIAWGVPTGERDVRGRQTITWSMLDAMIEQRPALDRSMLSTDRADNTVLVIFDPLAITDGHLFRWGSPPHVYRIKAVDGLLQDEETGTRYASEITVIR